MLHAATVWRCVLSVALKIVHSNGVGMQLQYPGDALGHGSPKDIGQY